MNYETRTEMEVELTNAKLPPNNELDQGRNGKVNLVRKAYYQKD